MIELSPKQTEAMQALESEEFDFILYGGAIRGGKTVWGLSALLVLCQIFAKSRWCVIREDMEKIRTTTIPSFTKLEASGKLRQSPYEYLHPNGSVILFKSENYAQDKDLDWMKGLEVNGILFEEINECQEKTLYKAFERSGTWIIKDAKYQPKPIVLGTCNPTFGWVKELVYNRWKLNDLPKRWKYIPAKITDNVDKFGKLNLPQAYIDNLNNLPRFEYMVFVEGNWDIQLKTGGEFLKSFELEKHVRPIKIDINNTIHVSIDSNVLPYIAVSIWQIEKEHIIGTDNFTKYHCKQVHELPARDPINTARKAAGNLVQWLHQIGYTDKIFIYGDPTTKNSNNIDDNKKSFFDLFTETLSSNGFLVLDKMTKSNKSVSSMGDFVNAILENRMNNIDICINETNKVSINDYIETKQDKDGGILKKRETDPKTKSSFEPNGHICDNFKDFICQAFESDFINFQRGKRDFEVYVGNNNSRVR